MIKIDRSIPYFVGNWKMNKSFGDLEVFFSNIESQNCHQWIAPQTIELFRLKQMLGENNKIQVGSQNHGHKTSGAFTGETSIEQLHELQIDFTIVGHSERRQIFHETDEQIREKVKLSLERHIPVILCIGETLEERENEVTFKVIENQTKSALQGVTPAEFSNLLIAYEPVWAIGTGKTATPEQAQEVHSFIRKILKELFGEQSEVTPILYGGSVKPNNVKDLMAMDDIDGALIGGASLDIESYNQLCKNGA